MTIIAPHYTRHKPLYWLWKTRRRTRALIHGYRRNPDCNERRRYRDDTLGFTSGEHKHVEPIFGTDANGVRHRFERVAVPFRPMRFDGPTYSNGLALNLGGDVDVLSSWNWFDTGTVSDG